MGTQASTSALPLKSTGSVLWSVGVWLFVVLLAMVALWELRAPAPVPATAPADKFSAERALAHLQVITKSPHSIGSPANAAVRDYLVARLSALQLAPQIFPAIGVNRGGNTRVVIGNTQDVIARLPGTASSGAILLMAHYDSVYRAPGAADDGAGVAAILEVVRALRSGAALRNDLIVVLTDGEEAGLLGAEAFVAAHPWMRDIGVILNFEARGDQGPSLLFETSAGNRKLIESVAAAASYPTGSSLFYSFYKLLPNDTDFTVFRPSATPGLNFAFGAGLAAYHTSLDNIHDLSLSSLQHHGSYALDLVRYFGQMDIKELQQPHGDDVFFDWLGYRFVAYSEGWVLPGQIVVTLLLICTLLLSAGRSGVPIARILLALFPAALILVIIPLISVAIWWLVARILAGRMIFGDAPANSWLLAGTALAGIALGSVALHWLRRRFTVWELSLAGLVLVCILSWPLALLLPAGSYLLFWPLLFATIGSLLIAARRRIGQASELGIMALPATAMTVLLFAPVAYLLYIFLTLQIITVLAVGLLLGLFFLLSIPLLNIAIPRERWRSLALVLLVCSLTSIAVGAKLSHASPQHPRRDTILYSLNSDDQTAKWISYDRSLDDWTTHFIDKAHFTNQPVPDFLAGSQRSVISAPASPVQLAPPMVEITSHTQQGETHNLRMNIRSQRGAEVLFVAFNKEVELLSLRIGGREVARRPNSKPTTVILLGMPAKGADLELTIKALSGISFWLMDQSAGLPAEPPQRPGDLVAGDGSDVTVVCRKYSL